MHTGVPFHFLLLGIGEVLNQYEYASDKKLQSFIYDDGGFSINVPLGECRLALDLMERVGFVKKNIEGNYVRNHG